MATVAATPTPLAMVSALECDACKAAANSSPHPCSHCGLPIAPAHYVQDVHRSTESRNYAVDAPYYPSGNPATGPTYFGTASRTDQIEHVRVRWSDGRQADGPHD